MKKILLIIGLCVAALISGLYFTKGQIDQFVVQPLSLSEPTLFTVKPGTSFPRVLSQLEQQGAISNSPFSDYIRFLHPDLLAIKAGTYQLQPEWTLRQALKHLIAGREHQFAITFVEGSIYQEWLEVLKQAPHLDQTIADKTEQQIAGLINAEHEKLEGLLLAETYYYTAGTSDLDILKRANRKLTKTLEKHWQQRQDKLPLKSAYEALILASIIEKETAVAEERAKVSSVFVNRLNKRMRLQTDPTVIYGMGDKFDGNIRKRDLRTPTPYNTYVIKGLPPTPIAMVGEDAIRASVNPDDTSYLYFVASGHGDHIFSKTLKEHNRAVQAYLKVLRSRK